MDMNEIEYDQTVGKAILTGLGYVAKPTHPDLHKRLAMHTKLHEASVIDASVTMIYKPDPTTAHMITFAVIQLNGENLPVVQSTFGKIADSKLKLGDPEQGVVVGQSLFNHGILHAHPAALMLNLQERIDDVLASGTEQKKQATTIPENIESAAEEALRDALKKYGKSGLPAKHCDA